MRCHATACANLTEFMKFSCVDPIAFISDLDRKFVRGS
jgi:hypothetical protein